MDKTPPKTPSGPGGRSLKRKERHDAQVSRELASPLDEATLAKVMELSSRGWNEAAIHHSLGISEKIWTARKKAQPELVAAIKAGRGLDLHTAVNALRRAALDDKGNVRADPETGMPHKTCLTALLAYLKLVHHARDHGAPAGGPSADGVRVNIINLQRPLTPEEYAASLALPGPKVTVSADSPPQPAIDAEYEETNDA